MNSVYTRGLPNNHPIDKRLSFCSLNVASQTTATGEARSYCHFELGNRAELDRGWKPCTYAEARMRIAMERNPDDSAGLGLLGYYNYCPNTESRI